MFNQILHGITHTKYINDLDSTPDITVNFTDAGGNTMHCNYVCVNIGKNQTAGNAGQLLCKFLGYSKHGSFDPSTYVYFSAGLPGIIVDVSKPFKYSLGHNRTITGIQLSSMLTNQNREIQITYGILMPFGEGIKIKNLNPGI